MALLLFLLQVRNLLRDRFLQEGVSLAEDVFSLGVAVHAVHHVLTGQDEGHGGRHIAVAGHAGPPTEAAVRKLELAQFRQVLLQAVAQTVLIKELSQRLFLLGLILCLPHPRGVVQ